MAGPKPNAGISVARCPKPTCNCGCLTVRLHDANGQATAGIVLPRLTAEAFFAQFGAVLGSEPAPAPNTLRTIRCEGTA